MSGLRAAIDLALAFALPWLAGFMLLRLIPGHGLDQREAVALSYPLGLGVIYATLLPALAVLRPPSAYRLVLSVLALLVLTGVRAGRPPAPVAAAPRASWAAIGALLLVVLAFAALTLVLLPDEFDSMAGWAIKGRHLMELGLERSLFHRMYMHRSYPLLTSAQYAWIGLSHGGWDDRFLGLVPVLMLGSALALFVESLRRARAPAWVLLAGALFAASPGLQPIVLYPMADVPLAANLLVAALFMHRSYRRRTGGADCLLAGIFIALASVTKNEGAAAAAVWVPFCLLLARRCSRRVVTLVALLGPVVVLRGFWQLLLHACSAAGAFEATPYGPLRLADVPAEALRTLRFLAHDLVMSHVASGVPDDWLFLAPALAAAIVARPRAFAASGAWLPAALAAAILPAYAVANVVSPWPHEWLLETAVQRQAVHASPLLLLALGITLAHRGAGEQGDAAVTTRSLVQPAS